MSVFLFLGNKSEKWTWKFLGLIFGGAYFRGKNKFKNSMGFYSEWQGYFAGFIACIWKTCGNMKRKTRWKTCVNMFCKPNFSKFSQCFMTPTRKEVRGVLKLVTCLWILLFLNNRSIVHFFGWWGYGGQKIGHFLWTSWIDDPWEYLGIE